MSFISTRAWKELGNAGKFRTLLRSGAILDKPKSRNELPNFLLLIAEESLLQGLY